MQQEPEFHYSALWLTGICIIVFILQVMMPNLTNQITLVSRDAFIHPWTFITSIFAHGSMGHLLSNMFALALFGSILERFIGTKKFLLVFFATGIFAGFIGMLYYNALLGASGAIFGILGTLAIMRPGMIVWVSYIPMPMIVAAGVWAFLDYMGIFAPGNVANISHLAGLGFGLIIGVVFRFTMPRIKMEKREINSEEEKELDEYEKNHGLR